MADKTKKSDKDFQDQPTEDQNTDIGGQAGGQSSDLEDQDMNMTDLEEDDDLGAL